MAKFMKIFREKLEAEDNELPPEKIKTILNDFKGGLEFLTLIDYIFKDFDLDYGLVKQTYQILKVEEAEWNQIVALMKKALIQSKTVKKPVLLKQAVNDLSKLRDSIQFDESYLQKFNSALIEASLYERVNKIEGLNIIMEKVFEEIVKDEVLSPFYKDKNI